MPNGWYCDEFILAHYVNIKSHNEKCPSVIHYNGNKYWKQNDKDHRLDGPARELNDGRKFWFYQDKHINCNTQKDFEKIIKLKLLW